MEEMHKDEWVADRNTRNKLRERKIVFIFPYNPKSPKHTQCRVRCTF